MRVRAPFDPRIHHRPERAAAEPLTPELPERRRVGDGGAVELSVFEEVAEALRGLAPPELGTYRNRAHRYGVKVWFGAAAPLATLGPWLRRSLESSPTACPLITIAVV